MARFVQVIRASWPPESELTPTSQPPELRVGIEGSDAISQAQLPTNFEES